MKKLLQTVGRWLSWPLTRIVEHLVERKLTWRLDAAIDRKMDAWLQTPANIESIHALVLERELLRIEALKQRLSEPEP